MRDVLMGVCSVGHLSLLLRSEGFVITHAAGKKETAELLGERRFDLALVDISLPDGNGFVVCTEIRESQTIPVIFLTASGDETSVVTGLNMGADDYITKPFRSRELVARIKTALRKSDKGSSVFELGGLLVDTGNGIVILSISLYTFSSRNLLSCLLQ